MKVLFVNVGVDNTYPTGIGAVSAFLRKNGHETRLVDLVVSGPFLTDAHYALIKVALLDFQPCVAGFTVFETGFHWIRQICRFIKGINPSIITVAGGYYPTLSPENVISDDSVDIICRGEGEYAILELVNNLENDRDIKNIQNLWVKEKGAVIKNGIRPLIERLDDLPFWDRKMFDYQDHLNQSTVGHRNVKVMASRGCPYHCTYCSNYYFKQLYSNGDKYLRMRSVDHLVAELRHLKEHYDFDYVGFHDDNLTLFTKWLKEFSGKYKNQVGVPFYCAARVETCSDENLDLLKEAGCFMVLIGVESGDETYRKKMMNRQMSDKVITGVCRKIKERKMMLWTFNMVGMPHESKRELRKTIELNWSVKPDFAMAAVYYPFKGTEMGDVCYKDGIVDFRKKESVGSYANNSILTHPSFSNIELKIAKYLITFSAMRSGFFYRQLYERLRNKIAQLIKSVAMWFL